MPQAAVKEKRATAEATTFDLHKQIEAAKLLRSQMADIAASDPEFMADIVEGQTDLRETITALVESVVVDGALVDGIDEVVDRLSARRDRITKRIEAKRTLIALGMEVGGLPKIETPVGTVSVKAVPPKLVVTEEADIPAKFWKPANPTLDKAAILAALKERARAMDTASMIGEQTLRNEALAVADREHPEIPGACLSNGSSTIQIRA